MAGRGVMRGDLDCRDQRVEGALAELDRPAVGNHLAAVWQHLEATELERRRILERTARGRANAERHCSATRQSDAVASCSNSYGAFHG